MGTSEVVSDRNLGKRNTLILKQFMNTNEIEKA